MARKKKEIIEGADLNQEDITEQKDIEKEIITNSFVNADYRSVDFTNKIFKGVDFTNAVLQGCNFTGSEFIDCIYDNVDARWAINFGGSDGNSNL